MRRAAALICIFVLCAAAPPARPQQAPPGTDTDAARAAVQALVDEGIALLSNGGGTATADKERAFAGFLDANFAMPTIARFALGRHWRAATPAQQEEYTRLFTDMIVRRYTAQFTEYTGQTVTLLNAKPAGSRDVLVSSRVTQPGGGAPVAVDWRVRQDGAGAWRVIDVAVEGVSMAQTYRADFDAAVQRGGGDIEALLAFLRAQTGEGA
jgi:phospholipid transport system substrate-binding protein